MNKKEKMEVALSKLTIEEQKLLGLIKKPKAPKVKKNHKLKVFYMIGDADGDTDVRVKVSINNPFLKHITEALDKMEEPEKHWGLRLHIRNFKINYNKKNINELEFDLLCLVYNYSNNENDAIAFFKKHGFENSETNQKYLLEFEGLLIDECEYSFLIYKGYALK
jgi:hypothetical protein